MNFKQNFTNENRPAIIKGFVISYSEEVIKVNDVDVDKATILVVSKTKDSVNNYRDQFFEINAYNGVLKSSGTSLSRIKKALADKELIRGTFEVWLNGDQYETQRDKDSKKKSPEMVTRYSTKLSLCSVLEVAFTDVVYTYEGEEAVIASGPLAKKKTLEEVFNIK